MWDLKVKYRWHSVGEWSSDARWERPSNREPHTAIACVGRGGTGGGSQDCVRVLRNEPRREKRELVRSIFNLANMEIVKRARPSSTFNFAKASIGNLFLTG